MKPIPKVIYQTPEEIDEVIKEREAEAALLPPGATKQSVLVDVARLRSYADMKRLLAIPRLIHEQIISRTDRPDTCRNVKGSPYQRLRDAA